MVSLTTTGRVDCRKVSSRESHWLHLEPGLGVVSLVLAATIQCTAVHSSEPLSQNDRTSSREPSVASEQAVQHSLASPQTASEVEDKLLAAIQSELPVTPKTILFQQLQLVATPRAVPVLAAMLSDTNLSHGARSVLEVLPGQVPNTALSRALNETRKNQLIGIIGTLGNRRGRDTVTALVPLLTNSEVQVVTATVSALGKIASDDALAALKGVACAIEPPLLATGAKEIPLAPRVRYRLNMGVVLDALLECSETMSQQGRTNAAAQICAQLAASEVAPWPGRVAAIGALARLDAAQAMPFVLNMLKQQDQALQALGASLARNMPHPALESLFTILYACPVHAQISVVESLADCADPALVPLLLKATRYPDPHVQAAAARSLARFSPTTEIIQRLAELASGDGPQANAAIDTIVALPHDKADAAILASLRSANDSVLPGLIRAAGQRGLATALPAIVRASVNDNPRLRSTAIEAIGRLGGHQELELLQQQISKASSATDIVTIADALTEISRRLNEPEVSARLIVGVLNVTDAQTKLRLYDCLARLGGTTALNAVRQAAASDDPATKEHAVSLLANWPDTSALDELIAIAKIEYVPACRSIVLRGIANLIARPSARTPDQTFEIYAQALQLALTSNEKKLLIPGLASLGLPEARNMLKSYLSDPELQDEAAKGIVQCIVDLFIRSPSKAREEIALLRSANISQKLNAALDVLLSLAANHTNAVNTWLIAGPYSNDGLGVEQLLDTPFPPEEPTASVDWNSVSTNEGATAVVLAPASANQVVYLASCIVSDREQRAKLRLLARTPVRIWLNNVPVNATFASPPNFEPQQLIDVTLRKGENRLVVKLPVSTNAALLACTVDASNPVRTRPLTKSSVWLRPCRAEEIAALAVSTPLRSSRSAPGQPELSSKAFSTVDDHTRDALSALSRSKPGRVKSALLLPSTRAISSRNARFHPETAPARLLPETGFGLRRAAAFL